MSGEGFIAGVWCGSILGGAVMLVVISLCMAARPEHPALADEEQARRLRERGW